MELIPMLVLMLCDDGHRCQGDHTKYYPMPSWDACFAAAVTQTVPEGILATDSKETPVGIYCVGEFKDDAPAHSVK